MRIGLTGGASDTDKLVEQAKLAEAQGFTSLWYASAVLGDPLVAMAVAAQATERIELGTAVLQTYPCHPILQANRAAAAAAAIGRSRFTLGIGPSHASLVRDIYGLSYDHPGRNTEEYVRILSLLLKGEAVEFEGDDWTAHAPAGTVVVSEPVPVLLAALGPRLLRVAGEWTDGVISWTAPIAAIERHISPRVRAAAAEAGRPAPRIVAGLPVVVHDDRHEAREAVARTAAFYGSHPNYVRIMELGGAESPADVAIVGDEESVRRQLQDVLDAGATELWLNVIGAGEDRQKSRQRCIDLLRDLVDKSVSLESTNERDAIQSQMLHVRGRDIPVPTSVSTEAQSILANGSTEPAVYPAPDDLEAWRSLIATADDQIAEGFKLMLPMMADVDVVDRTINGTQVYVVTPPGLDPDDRRVYLEIHGGSLIFCGGEICRGLGMMNATRHSIRMWAVDYRMPPDHPFPAGLDDCVQTSEAMLDEYRAEQIVVGGLSAGANLAASLVLRVRDERLPMPAGVVLLSPELDLTESGDSFRTLLGVDTTLTSGLLPINELYGGDHQLADPYLSPLF